MLSILITHYNRPKALAKCVNALRVIDWPLEYEIVVADDCSTHENKIAIKTIQIDTLLLSDKNVGLASNINKGLRACKGDYILYVQEDFLIEKDFISVIDECLIKLDNNILDMIRFCANYKFAHLILVSENISKIPHFSFRNFNINTFQYSDNPYITKKSFFEKYGYFIENSSGGYGETEFAIRLLNAKVKIGITKKRYFNTIKGVASVIDNGVVIKQKGIIKPIWRFARALRQHLEWFLYNPKIRGLYTYKNKR